MPVARLSLALAVVLGAAACQEGPTLERQPVLVLGVDDQSSQAGAGFDVRRAEATLSRSLAASRHLRLVEQREATAFRAELAILLASERSPEHGSETGVYRAVQVELRLVRRSQPEPEILQAQGSSFQVQEPGSVPSQEGFRRILDDAIAQAVERIDLQLETRGMPVEKLRALLASADDEDRLYVLRVLRERRVPSLVPRVIELLREPDPALVLEAVGVLVAQRDERAVSALIGLAQAKDAVFLLQIITAVAEIGGPLARAYLFTLAAGHPEAQIRARALEGFERVQRATDEQAGPVMALPRDGK